MVGAGANIGSAAIDYDFERLVMTRLKQAEMIECDAIAWEMMKSSDFQNTKCAHGGPDDTPIFSIQIPKISPAYVNPVLRIRNGQMEFMRLVVWDPLAWLGRSRADFCTRWELQNLFDKQIGELVRLIDTQLRSKPQKFPNEQVVGFLLS